MKLTKRLVTVFMIAVILITTVPTAKAADGNVNYLGKAYNFIFSPGSRYSPTDLFPNFKDVMPGDSITQNIYLNNLASRSVKIKVYMRALGAHEDSEEFLSQMNLTVEKVEDTIMFDAPASARAQLTEWTYLGTLYAGGDVELKVTLDVPVTMGNEFQDAVGYLDWEFMIEELPRESTDPEPPKTGDQIMGYVYTLVGSGAALFILLLIYKKKKEKNGN